MSTGSQNALKQTYDRVLQSIMEQHPSRRNLAFKALSWLVEPRNPMNPHGLSLAVSNHVGSYGQAGDNVPEIESMCGAGEE